MNKLLLPMAFSYPDARRGLDAFSVMLGASAELSEADQVRPLFDGHPQLAALAATYHLPQNFDVACREFDLFGNFRCDWAVGDTVLREYVLIEFEDARRDSVFDPDSRYHERWGDRFERGFSQLVDWFWILDRYRDNIDFRRRFGDGHVKFSGLLVIGRRQFLTGAWRFDRVTVNTHKVYCVTFDDPYDFLHRRLEFLRGMARASE
jgi:hypothetical protein